jgi:hypothetical protein
MGGEAGGSPPTCILPRQGGGGRNGRSTCPSQPYPGAYAHRGGGLGLWAPAGHILTLVRGGEGGKIRLEGDNPGSGHAPVSLAWSAWRIFSDVTGRSVMLTPTASKTALTMAGATAPMGCSPMDLPP